MDYQNENDAGKKIGVMLQEVKELREKYGASEATQSNRQQNHRQI